MPVVVHTALLKIIRKGQERSMQETKIWPELARLRKKVKAMKKGNRKS
jgi:hypothetical protein